MRAVITAVFASAVLGAQTAPSPQAAGQQAAPPTFRLFFLGHEIGAETDTVTKSPQGSHLEAVFRFVDRGTAIDLTGTVDQALDGTPRHFSAKGKNYRLFTSDSEVTIADRDVHVHDLKQERDLQTGTKPFFPVDNYAPIGIQQALIQVLAGARTTGRDRVGAVRACQDHISRQADGAGRRQTISARAARR